MKKGQIVAMASVIAHPAADWELAGVLTLETYRGQGYGKAVCTFITDCILSVQPQARCQIETNNAVMLHIAESLGYQRQAI